MPEIVLSAPPVAPERRRDADHQRQRQRQRQGHCGERQRVAERIPDDVRDRGAGHQRLAEIELCHVCEKAEITHHRRLVEAKLTAHLVKRVGRHRRKLVSRKRHVERVAGKDFGRDEYESDQQPERHHRE